VSDDATAMISRALGQPPDVSHFGIKSGKLQLDNIGRGARDDVLPAEHTQKNIERRSIEDQAVQGRMIARAGMQMLIEEATDQSFVYVARSGGLAEQPIPKVED